MLKTDFNLIQHTRSKKKTVTVTMGAYDGAEEVCEIVGIYLLSLLSEKYNNKEIGLYSDAGLSVFKNINGLEAEKMKEIYKEFSNKRV